MPARPLLAALAAALLAAAALPARAQGALPAADLTLYGAGSLREVMTEMAAAFSAKSGLTVRTQFGPSGLMREKIEAGDKVDVFASADLGHPQKLAREGRARQAVMFTRNALCATAAPALGLTEANFLDKLLSPEARLATSTPNADPSGDYTWAMFRLADKQRPGAYAALDGKAQKIVGGSVPTPGQPAPPNPIVEGFKAGTVNVTIGYCTSAAQLRRDLPDAQVMPVPAAIRTGPEYGLALMKDADPRVVDLALYILSPEGQAILAKHGFNPIGLPSPTS